MDGPVQPGRAPEDGRGASATVLATAVWSRPRLPAAPAPWPTPAVGLLVALLDTVGIVGAGFAADAITALPGSTHTQATLLITAMTIGLGAIIGTYDLRILFTGAPQLKRTLLAALGALVVTLVAGLAFGAGRRLDPVWFAVAIPLGTLSLSAGRAAVGGLLRQDGHDRVAPRAVLVGAGPQADRLAAALRRQGRSGLRILGLVDDGAGPVGRAPEGVTELGGLQNLTAMIRRGEVDQVVLTMPWSAEERISAALQRLSLYPVEVRLAPDLLAHELPGRQVWPVLLRACPISGWQAVVKRAEDLVLAIGALAVAAIPMLLIALAVKLDSPGPVLFRQRRTGFNDQPFYVLKFRTMYDDAADHEVRQQVAEGDPRVTRVGAILRRTSLDELPQILNVLWGEMSFVGPRPHAPGTRAGGRRFEEVVANYAARHRVKPGLTGLAQVRGFRGPTPTEEQVIRRVESDLEYIESWSLWLDLVIILRTLHAVAQMRNAC